MHASIAETKQLHLLVGAFRNAYDHAFNLDGELFTFDSDMEWDINMPWYRDVRTVHGIPGGDYGYRNGSGKFPAVLHRLAAAACATSAADRRSASSSISTRLSDGVPRRLLRGRLVARPPALDRRSTRKGATYTATKEKDEFVHGEPLNITDVEVGPDGLVYFTIGGRMHRRRRLPRDATPARSRRPRS